MARKLILKVMLSPGDICTLTAAIESLHATYPGEYITDVRTSCNEIFQHNPRITKLTDGDGDLFELHYDTVLQRCDGAPDSFLSGYCDDLGRKLGLRLQLTTNRPHLYLSYEEKSWMNQVEADFTRRPTKFWLVNAGVKRDFTLKQWPVEYYQEVIDEFRGRIQFVQVGAAEHDHPELKNVINLVGKTDARQLIRLAYHAQGGLGPVTFLQHLCAAFEKPYVALLGGREPVSWVQYPLQTTLHTLGKLQCCRTKACWRSRVVPLADGGEQDKSLCDFPVLGMQRPVGKCMAIIRSADVIRAIEGCGTAIIDSLQYAYVAFGTAAGKMLSVTWRQQRGGGAWNYIEQATFAFYGTSDANGSVNDLLSATEQLPDGMGGWNTVAVHYYRYWLAGSSTGFAHGLKMHFGPEAYRLMFNAGINLSTATDATVLPYADHYYEYDSSRRVTKEISAVCESCTGGGTTSDLFSYTPNPRSPTPGPNVWAMKTVQTLPDSSQVIVYTNYIGLPMLYIVVDPTGANKWCTFYRYNASAQVIWQAMPSAVNGYDDANNDLLNFNSGTGLYQYLNNSTGLIYVTDYYASGSGQPVGYMADNQVQQGQSGTPVKVRSFTYSSNTAGGITVNPIASTIDYPTSSSTPTITTSYAYTYFSGTNLVQSRTITPPVVSTGQNGSGSTYTIVETFDSYGNLTSRADERGIVNTYSYSGLGLVSTQVLNYQSGVTQPGVNVTTDFTHDGQGRILQSLGPAHTVVLSGTATSVRNAMFYVYLQSVQPGSGTWAPDQTLVGNGYLASGTYSLINPVSIINADKDGRVTDQITSKRTTGSGALGPTNTFAQSDWQTWSSTQYNNQHQTISSRVYHLIPSTGIGTVGTNFGETDFGYDTLERQNRIVAPGGTITRRVWTTPQRVASVWVGTNDTGATDSNPAGSGSPNNMVMVSANTYDGGGIGDGNPTAILQYASPTDVRTTLLGYDFRDRKISLDGEVDVYEQYTHDNLDRKTQTDRFDTSASGNLIGRTQTAFDDRSQPYQTKIFAVDPSTGTIGNALIGNNWYDPSGNEIQQIAPGDGIVFSKNVYNGVNWILSSYRGYNASGTSYSQAGTVANDTILEQVDNTFDEAGNTINVAASQRLNDTPATGTGSTGALSYGTQPKARVMYMASWFDGIDRPIASANYGAIASFSRPSTPPASSDTILVNLTAFDNAGRVYQVTDPKGIVDQTLYDNANRTTQTIEALGLSVARTTNYTYTLDNLTATMTAVNSGTGNQTTTWTYGTTLSTSGVARNDLLASITYPDSVSGSDVVSHTYNRLGQQATITDQRGNVRTLSYDKLGRLTDDGVTTLASGTDGTVRRISRAYEVRGMVNLVSSYNNATPGSGTVLNQCKLTFNTFGQLSKEQQEHSGAVTSGSLNVQYGYDTGASSSNQIRPNLLTYPNNRAITFSFGTSGGMNDLLNRVDTIEDTTSGTTNLASYSYLGIGTPILIDYPQPQVKLDLWGGTSGSFVGLDLFNRIASQGWVNYNTSSDVFRLNYGYDRNSNRLYAQNTTQKGASQAYTYDQLNQLLTYKAGMIKSDLSDIAPNWTLDATRWTLDPTGNQTAVDYPNSFGSNSFAWLNWFQNTANTVNEYTTRKSYSGSKGRIWDKFTANTTANWSSPGSSVTFTVSTSAQTLTVNTIGQDTIDGYLEPQAQALILTGEAIGPTIPGVTFVIPTGTTTGQVGLVFGYKSGADYWLWARDMNGTAKIYHVLNGVSTQVASTTYPAPVAGTATGAFFIGGWSFSEYAPAYSFGTGGFPSGKIGFYTNIAGVAFSSFSSWEQAPVHLNGRWINDASYAVNLTTDQSLTLPASGATEYNAILLENLRLKKFQTTFALTRATGQSQSLLGLIFNAAERGNYNYVSITHTGTVINPIGYVVAPSAAPATASGGSNPSNIPTCAATDTLWCRAQNDGTTFTLKCINSATAPSETTWSSTSACYSNASLSNIGGQIGFNCNQGIGYISQFTLKSWNTATSAFDITEHWDNFTVDSSGYANETPTYDAAGNLTYDGQQYYTWDAWNRLMTIAHAYRDSGSTLQHGQVFDTMAYDGRNRRIQKTVGNTGQWDCNYHYYYTNSWQLIETRNGSSQTLKQHVWGIRYIDELVQVAANSNPSTGNTCSGWFYAMQDANFNVLGLVNTSGNLVERYEYTPYGQRKVLFAAGNTWAGGTSANDPGCYAIAYASLRYAVNAPYASICDIGHQGLMHDEECGWVYNRRRFLNLSSKTFSSRDALGYSDGPNMYRYLSENPLTNLDPFGLAGSGVLPKWLRDILESERIRSHGNRGCDECANLPSRELRCECIEQHIAALSAELTVRWIITTWHAAHGSTKQEIATNELQIKEKLRAIAKCGEKSDADCCDNPLQPVAAPQPLPIPAPAPAPPMLQPVGPPIIITLPPAPGPTPWWNDRWPWSPGYDFSQSYLASVLKYVIPRADPYAAPAPCCPGTPANGRR